MSVYKDEKLGTWYVQMYYKTWDGKTHHTTKRGFRTKKDAVKWEAEKRASVSSDLSMTVESFVEVYFNDKKNELKERTLINKRYMIEKHIIPVFGKKKMNEIQSSEIIAWQNQMIEQGFADTYLRMVQNQMTALFTHAAKIYGLKDNPCSRVRKMGRSDAKELQFWTKEEYDCFIGTFDVNDRYYTLFELLFWTGIREGEALALTGNDVNYEKNTIRIDKTYYRSKGKDIITEPKTEQSIRTVDIPEFLKQELQDYVSKLYKYPKDARLFPVVAEAVQHKMKRHIEKAGVKKIRVHDLRHSHVAYLIHQGVEPLLIKARLGHRDIKITLNTYGHLYPNEQKKLAEMLNTKK